MQCECADNYTGFHCRKCNMGFYRVGSYCQRCDCSSNENPAVRDYCDPVTGSVLSIFFVLFALDQSVKQFKNQGVALTRRNTTGPPCSVVCPTTHMHSRPSTRPAAGRPDRRRSLQTTTDASEQNNTGPLAGQ